MTGRRTQRSSLPRGIEKLTTKKGGSRESLKKNRRDFRNRYCLFPVLIKSSSQSKKPNTKEKRNEKKGPMRRGRDVNLSSALRAQGGGTEGMVRKILGGVNILKRASYAEKKDRVGVEATTTMVADPEELKGTPGLKKKLSVTRGKSRLGEKGTCKICQ